MNIIEIMLAVFTTMFAMLVVTIFITAFPFSLVILAVFLITIWLANR